MSYVILLFFLITGNTKYNQSIDYEHLKMLEDEFKFNLDYAEKQRDKGNDSELERTIELLYVIQGFICAEDKTRENCEYYEKDLKEKKGK